MFTSGYPGGPNEEEIDGVKVVRRGDRLSVYRQAKRFYETGPERFDVIIDEINTVPFMTPRFVRRGERVVALIHQLAREFWYYEMPYPVAWAGYHYFEYHWLKKYRDIMTVTVSNSTKNELLGLGFKDVHVVPNGLNVDTLNAVPKKTSDPSIVFVGRLKKAKRPQDVAEAYSILKDKLPTLRLTVVGDGYLLQEMRVKYPDVDFRGYVDRTLRDELVASSWVIAVPGVREGWGQVVTDSNALGTPAVGYDIPGLRDSIQDGYNGLLVKPDPTSMAQGLHGLLSDDEMRTRLSANALDWSRRFSWEKSAQDFESLLK